MTQPKPIDVLICDTCNESWDLHLRHALIRKRREWDEEQDWGDHDVDSSSRPREVHDQEVFLEDCIYVLRNRNIGPTGPVGVAGAEGRPGKDAR